MLARHPQLLRPWVQPLGSVEIIGEKPVRCHWAATNQEIAFHEPLIEIETFRNASEPSMGGLAWNFGHPRWSGGQWRGVSSWIPNPTSSARISVEAYFLYRATTDGQNFGGIFDSLWGNTGTFDRILVAWNNTLTYYQWDGSWNPCTAGPLVDGQFYHAVGVSTPSGDSLHINGRLVSQFGRGGGINYGAASYFVTGRGNNEQSVSTVFYSNLFFRALGPDEIAARAAQPFAFVQPVG